jgi:2-polyprenyl-3-methyl-5-hydroxy-6-metoxy-1,4-benzoquinol methylase
MWSDIVTEFQYDEWYWKTYFKEKNGHEYGFQEPWLSFFGTVAEQLVKQFRPTWHMDVGCGMGILVYKVQRLKNYVYTYGIDISEFAIKEGREYCNKVFVHDIRNKLECSNLFDLVTCIEVVEHIPEADVDHAIANISAIVAPGKYLVFSSDPDDDDNPSHENVQPEEYWVEKFNQFGLKKVTNYDVSYITPHAIVLRKANHV